MGNCFRTETEIIESNISKNTPEIDVTKVKSAKPVIIILIGGPGSGKGTQAKRISEKYELLRLSIGDLLREEITSGSKRGITVAQMMNDGDLVPTETVLDLLKERMNQSVEKTKGFVIDGFLREKSQATLFENEIIPVDLVIYLQVNDTILRERLQARAIICGRNYDINDAIDRHIKVFRKHNENIVKYLKEKIIYVNGEPDADVVFADVCGAVEQILEKRERQV